MRNDFFGAPIIPVQPVPRPTPPTPLAHEIRVRTSPTMIHRNNMGQIVRVGPPIMRPGF